LAPGSGSRRNLLQDSAISPPERGFGVGSGEGNRLGEVAMKLYREIATIADLD
jgi:hypothetical protein